MKVLITNELNTRDFPKFMDVAHLPRIDEEVICRGLYVVGIINYPTADTIKQYYKGPASTGFNAVIRVIER